MQINHTKIMCPVCKGFYSRNSQMKPLCFIIPDNAVLKELEMKPERKNEYR